MNIKKNDTVIVLSGKDKGVKGKVLVAMPKDNKVIVEKVTDENGRAHRRLIRVCKKCGADID